MERPKILPPTLRTKKRYIVFEILSENQVEYHDFIKAFWFSCLSFLGELKTSESEIWVIKNLYNSRSQQGVIRCRHDMTEYVRTALGLISKIGDTNAIVKVLGITGTIDSAKRKYLGFTGLEDFKSEAE